MVRYEMRHDFLYHRDIGKYEAYGIDVYEGEELIRSIRDVTTQEKELLAFVQLLNKLNLELIHLDCVIEDFLQMPFDTYIDKVKNENS